MSVANIAATNSDVNNGNINITSKNCAPFSYCINKQNKEIADR